MSDVISAVHQRSGHTQLRPFDKMPAELVSAIIKFTRLPMYSSGPANQDTTNTCLLNMEVLITCSQVCSYWRRAALSLPSLWTEFVLTDETASTFITRSASYRLRLIGLETEEGDMRFLQWLPHNVYRVESLSITSGRHETISDILSAFDGAVTYPKLVRLDIDHTPLFDEDTLFFPAVAISMPNLHILHLCQASINVNLLSDLTELSLKSTFFENDRFKCSAEQLFTLLLRSPRLERLTLEEILLEPPRNSSANVVELPQLRSLRLKEIYGQFSGPAWFLTHIHVPSWTPVEPASPCGDNDIDLIRSSCNWSMMLLHIDVRKCHTLNFGPDTPTVDSMPISLQDDYRGSWQTISALLVTFGVAPMPALTIVVDGRPSRDSLNDVPAGVGVWAAFLARAPALGTLHVVAPREWMDDILSALCLKEQDVGLTGLLCPELRHLCVQIVHPTLRSASEDEAELSEEISYRASEYQEDPELPDTYAYTYAHILDGAEFNSRVVHFMEQRRRYGCPVMHIALNFGSPEFLEMLREHVEHVEVIVRDFWHSNFKSIVNSFVPCPARS